MFKCHNILFPVPEHNTFGRMSQPGKGLRSEPEPTIQPNARGPGTGTAFIYSNIVYFKI